METTQIQNESTFLKACTEGINLFAGSAFSVCARDARNNTLPTGSQLQAELRAEFKLDSITGLTLPQLCTIIESEHKDELYSFLKERYSVRRFDPAYQILDSLAVKSIFTTNIDDLFFKIYEHSNKHYLNDISLRGPAFSDKSAIDFIALHGTIAHNNENLTFGSSDIAASFSADPDKWHLLTGSIQRRPTIFWGYSVSDAGTLQALNSATTKGRPHQDKWIVLHQPTEGDRRYFGALGFQIIESDTASLLKFLHENIQVSHNDTATTRSTTDILPENALPAPGSVPVRPILDFFRGNPPTWHDVYAGRIPRTHHFDKINNLISAGSDAVVVGMPACGKTTLMMQLASQVTTVGHKLVCSFLTEDRAKLIVRKLEHDKALIFVDDFADSIESFNVLTSASNITVIGFDRDLTYEAASHKVTKSNLPVVDVSELNQRDIQEIFSVLPTRIRRDEYLAPRMVHGIAPSIFEIIENNITEPKLNQRFRSVLHSLHDSEPDLHDLLVMCAYVHACRTPVSFDMALAFMRPVVEGYEGVYNYFERLKNLVVEYQGEFTDADQDYFMPRSSLVAEAILSQVSSDAFKRVLLRFHSEVSSFRICRFDIFRRRAFDAEIIEKAFRSWQEGMEFYERQYQHDHSPYLRQQGALYLAHMKRYTEAFEWIDQAVSESQYKIPSIRNTHAIILFRANVSAPERNGTKRSTLDRSMSILAECYRYDRRKTYHAVTFADQALQYFNLYADKRAYGYLETSATWLKEEHRLKPWHNRLTRLLHTVEAKLRQ